jgi:hypothetical protein
MSKPTNDAEWAEVRAIRERRVTEAESEVARLTEELSDARVELARLIEAAANVSSRRDAVGEDTK